MYLIPYWKINKIVGVAIIYFWFLSFDVLNLYPQKFIDSVSFSSEELGKVKGLLRTKITDTTKVTKYEIGKAQVIKWYIYIYYSQVENGQTI